MLRTFREMVKQLGVESNQKESTAQAKMLVEKIRTDFETHMNNDLQVKDAFDALNITVSKLVELKAHNMLSDNDSEKAIEELKAIDYVLQAIF